MNCAFDFDFEFEFVAYLLYTFVRPKPISVLVFESIIFSETQSFFNFLFKNPNFSHVFPLLGDVMFYYNLENKPRESKNVQYLVID